MVDTVLQHRNPRRSIAQPLQPRRSLWRVLDLGAEQDPVDTRRLRRLSQNLERQFDAFIGAVEHEAPNRLAHAGDDVVTIGRTQACRSNTADASQALRIGFGIGASVQQRDLTAPSKLALVTMQGRIVNSDGTPPRADDHPQVRIKEPGLFGQIEEESINIDAEGRFQFDLCEGIRYSAYAFAGPMRTQTYSPPVEFVPAQENSRLVLTLGLTSEEFQKARRAFEGAAPPR